MTQTNKIISLLFSLLLGNIFGGLEQSFAIGVIVFQTSLSLCILMAITKETK